MAAGPPTLKRKSSSDDSDANDFPTSSPSKRQKVAFNPKVEIRPVEYYDGKSPILIREQVKRAIERHKHGESSEAYDEIRELFADSETSSSLLKKYIIALTSNIGLLSKDTSRLVHAVLDCSWLKRDDAFLGVYIRLLGSFVSAQGGYTRSVLSMLVSKFTKCTFFLH